jgi:radical SAM superfamily enzyme YgiQ (UPF0313 family)
MQIVLVNPYELGRQPFGLAQPTAWLRRAGFDVACIDLSLQQLDKRLLASARLVAIYLPMHTATRIAVAALPRIRAHAPAAHLCVYGLYAAANDTLFRTLGVNSVLGGESEPDLVELAQSLRAGKPSDAPYPIVRRDKIPFLVPERSALPPLSRYAHLRLVGGERKMVGFTETTRGCKHWCRHCPVVPVYQGRFRVVPVPVVLADVANQVTAGAQHISFGDPDFFNGPTHGLRVVQTMHEAFPQLTYDVTIKIQHIVNHASLLARLRDTGCLFIISAVESVEDRSLTILEKGHTTADFCRAVRLTREAGVGLAPTFVPFTPWTTLAGYVALLRCLVDLQLVASVPPVQLAIRLLVPQGSQLLELPEVRTLLGDFDAGSLGYAWQHTDRQVDELQATIQELVENASRIEQSRYATFAQIWAAAHQALGQPAPNLPQDLGGESAQLSEPWYCCAEPTTAQLAAF